VAVTGLAEMGDGIVGSPMAERAHDDEVSPRVGACYRWKVVDGHRRSLPEADHQQ
jgi:hypothetical protein